MLAVTRVLTSSISIVLYLMLIAKINSVWLKIKRNAYYLLPLFVSFFILFAHKFLVIANAVTGLQYASKLTLAHSLVFALVMQSFYLVDKYYTDRSKKIKAIAFLVAVLLTGYVTNIEVLAFAICVTQIYFIFISPNSTLAYAYAIYFLIDGLYVLYLVLGEAFLIAAYWLEPVATAIAYMGYCTEFRKILQDVPPSEDGNSTTGQ